MGVGTTSPGAGVEVWLRRGQRRHSRGNGRIVAAAPAALPRCRKPLSACTGAAPSAKPAATQAVRGHAAASASTAAAQAFRPPGAGANRTSRALSSFLGLPSPMPPPAAAQATPRSAAPRRKPCAAPQSGLPPPVHHRRIHTRFSRAACQRHGELNQCRRQAKRTSASATDRPGSGVPRSWRSAELQRLALQLPGQIKHRVPQAGEHRPGQVRAAPQSRRGSPALPGAHIAP